MRKNKLFKRISVILSSVVFFSSLSVLIGWIFDIPFLRNTFFGFIAMKPDTSLCFVLTSMSFWLLQEERIKNRLNHLLFYFCVSAVFVISSLVFCEQLFNWNPGIDRFLLRNTKIDLLALSQIRMAFNTSINFILLSIILFLSNFKKVFLYFLTTIISLLIGVSALFLFICYLYQADYPPIGIFSRNHITLHSSILFILVSLAYLFARPDKAIMKNVSSEYFGSFILRRILPVVVLVPLTLGWLKIHLEKANLFTHELGVALVAVLNLLTISAFVYMLALYLNRMDIKRRNMEIVLRDSKHKLERQTRLSVQHLKDMERSRQMMVSMLEDNNIIRERLEESLEELKYAQELMLQQEKLKAIGRLASGVAHEVKNPLGIISQGINYLKRKIPSKDKSSSNALTMMKASIERADKIINELLDFSKVNKLDLKPLNINSILESSMDLVRIGFKFEEVNIIREMQKNIPNVLVDKNKMEQVFINILLNAAQAMDYKGNIKVSSFAQKLGEDYKTAIAGQEIIFKAEEEVVIVEIEDEGIGISEENIRKIFDPFFSTKGPKGGAGLGLGVCLSIINLHRGLIDIKSQVGKGTKVSIILGLAGGKNE